MSGLIKIDEKSANAIQQVINECQVTDLAVKTQVAQALMMAQGISRLRELITTESMVPIMSLQGSSLGFRTDKDKQGGYPVAIVKDVFIEASLRGLRMTGNEVNIIADRCYVTKEGFTRLVYHYPGMTDIVLEPGVPKNDQNGAVVPYRASWKLNGIDGNLTRHIPCKGTAKYSSVDQYIGKATRKMLCSIYGIITGSQFSTPEGDIADSYAAGKKRIEKNPELQNKIDSLDDVFDPPSDDELHRINSEV